MLFTIWMSLFSPQKKIYSILKLRIFQITTILTRTHKMWLKKKKKKKELIQTHFFGSSVVLGNILSCSLLEFLDSKVTEDNQNKIETTIK